LRQKAGAAAHDAVDPIVFFRTIGNLFNPLEQASGVLVSFKYDPHFSGSRATALQVILDHCVIQYDLKRVGEPDPLRRNMR
jgi:hypothetical protein